MQYESHFLANKSQKSSPIQRNPYFQCINPHFLFQINPIQVQNSNLSKPFYLTNKSQIFPKANPTHFPLFASLIFPTNLTYALLLKLFTLCLTITPLSNPHFFPKSLLLTF